MYRKSKQSYHGAMAKRARKGEQHDCNADTGTSSQEASPNGSEVSVRPDGSKELSSDETTAPGGAAQNPEPVAARLGEHSHESEGQGASEAGTAQQLTQQVLALIQENHLHAPIVLPDPKELAQLRNDAPEIYALYVKAVDTQIKDESYTRRAPFEIRSSPVEWCNRFVSFGLGYALSWSGVSSCWVGWGVSRDLVRMSRLR